MSKKPIQPDFLSLDLGYSEKQSKFPMPCEDGTKSVTSTKSNHGMLDQYLEDQLLQIDEISQVFGKKRKSESTPATGCLVESWHEADEACDLAKLATDARALWEETRAQYESHLISQLSSCCTSMCSTVAAASSTVVSVSFTASMSVSSPPDVGSTMHFDLSQTAKKRDVACSLSGAQHDKRKRADSYGSDMTLAAACSLLIQSTAGAHAHAAVPARHVKLEPSAHRTAAAKRQHAIEEFSVGSGWPAP